LYCEFFWKKLKEFLFWFFFSSNCKNKAVFRECKFKNQFFQITFFRWLYKTCFAFDFTTKVWSGRIVFKLLLWNFGLNTLSKNRKNVNGMYFWILSRALSQLYQQRFFCNCSFSKLLPEKGEVWKTSGGKAKNFFALTWGSLCLGILFEVCPFVTKTKREKRVFSRFETKTRWMLF